MRLDFNYELIYTSAQSISCIVNILKNMGDDYMNFTKMHGLGNDFIVIENLNDEIKNLKQIAIILCERHTGIGADGILVVEKSQIADIRMRIINSDGSEAEMCGNGIRCFSKYVYNKGIINNKTIKIETLAGIIIADIEVDSKNIMSIKVNMGNPIFDKASIPFSSNENNIDYKIEIDGISYRASTILMGVPHTIIYVSNIDDSEVITVGRKIEKLPIFPLGTNVNFVKIIDRYKIELRTWERGAGMTLACGTGTCASVVAAHMNNLTENIVEAFLSCGKLKIEYNGENVFMEGPAELICDGSFNLIDMNLH